MSIKQAVVHELTQLAADLSGYEPEDLAPDQTFLELGFDSLFLTQLATAISNHFATQVTFRSLFSDYPSIDRLATHLEVTMSAPMREQLSPKVATTKEPIDQPPAAAAEQSTTVSADPVVFKDSQPSQPANMTLTTSTSANSALPRGISSLITEQLALMTQQLELLGVGNKQPAVQAPDLREVTALATEAAAELASEALPKEPPVQAGPEEPESIALPAGFGPGQISDQIAPSQRMNCRCLYAAHARLQDLDSAVPPVARRSSHRFRFQPALERDGLSDRRREIERLSTVG